MKLRSSEILQEFMRHKNFSMNRLARYAGCSHTFIQYLVKGTKTTCTESLAKRIAEALEVPVDALFEKRTSTTTRSDSNRRPNATAA